MKLQASHTLILALAIAGCRQPDDRAAGGDQRAREDHAASEKRAASEDHAAHGKGEVPPAATKPGNVVQQEMRLLTAALQTAVLSIGTGDVRAIEHQLHRVHAAKAATGKALADGSYRPPKNADKLERFAELDEAFHDQLRGLVQASRDNDVGGAAQALGGVMTGCQTCHSEFR